MRATNVRVSRQNWNLDRAHSSAGSQPAFRLWPAPSRAWWWAASRRGPWRTEDLGRCGPRHESLKPARSVAVSGVTLIEVIVATAICLVLAAIVVAVLARSREAGRNTACLANMRQIGQAALVYSADNDGYFPFLPYDPWTERIHLKPVLKCPDLELPSSGEGATFTGYSYNLCTQFLPVPNPSRIVMLTEVAIFHRPAKPDELSELSGVFEPDSYYGSTGFWGPGVFEPIGSWGSRRHFGMSHYVLYDGSVKSLPPEAIRVPDGGGCGNATRWFGPSNGPTFNLAGL